MESHHVPYCARAADIGDGPTEPDASPPLRKCALGPTTPREEPEKAAAVAESPSCDLTPAEYISLLFTDLGVLTPAAVSDELIRLYT